MLSMKSIMNSIAAFLCAGSLLFSFPSTLVAQKCYPVPTLESLIPQKEELDQRMKWFDEVRFGMFIHWGVYSSLSGTWNGIRYQGYGEHIQRMAKIPIAEYREKVVGTFNPQQFSAKEWVKLAKDAGMGYLVITAKHHDGFAMYDSQVSDYNIVKATPFGRDPIRELERECRKVGLKFGLYYSQAFDWGEKDAPGNDWDYRNPGGDLLLNGRDWWKKDSLFLKEHARKYVCGKAIPQLEELIRKYRPDLIWFDTPHKLPEEENLRIVAAVRRLAPNVVINGRAVEACADYASTSDRPAEFHVMPRYWEGIPTTNNSFAYNANDTVYKSDAHFVRLLVKAAARGGNILMNVGPKGNGGIDVPDRRILQGIARWWKINGEESIRGTQRTPLTVQSWGESTCKGDTLYLHIFQWPHEGRLLVGGLKNPVKKAWLLSDPSKELSWESKGKDMCLAVPRECPDSIDTVIAVVCDGEPMVDDRRLLNGDMTETLRTFDAQLEGGLRYGSEAERFSYVQNWREFKDAVLWKARLAKETVYDVYVRYAAPERKKSELIEGDAGKELKKETLGGAGEYEIHFANQKMTHVVSQGDFIREHIGQITLPAGDLDIRVKAGDIKGDELFRLRSLILVPVNSK